MLDMPTAQIFAWSAPGQQALDRIADASHPFFDVLFFRIGKAEAKLLLAATIYMERFANHKCHLILSYFTQQRSRPYITRQTTPEVEATAWLIDTRFFRPVDVDSLQHQVTFVLIVLAQHDQVVIQQVPLQNL